MPIAFAQLVKQAKDTYGAETAKTFARVIRVSGGTVSRYLHNKTTHPPGTDVCLRIARAGELSPARVLRAAGKSEVAELLDALYGLTVPTAVAQPRHRARRTTPAERRLIDQWRRFTPEYRRLASTIMEVFLEQSLRDRSDSTLQGHATDLTET